MSWEKIKETVGKYAPMAGTLLGGAPGAAIGSLIASTLGVENTPEAVERELKNNPDAIAKLKMLEESNRHSFQMAVLDLQRVSLQEQATTQRAELKSNDKYVARWRPTFGYILAFSFLVINVAFAYVVMKVVQDPTSMAATVTALSGLLGPISIIWGFAMSVLGINIHQRSKDKQTAAGIPQGDGLLSKLKGALGK